MILKTLDNPTVAEVIAFLQQLPPETPFLIRDADTGWTIREIHTEKDSRGVWFGGEYFEMSSDDTY